MESPAAQAREAPAGEAPSAPQARGGSRDSNEVVVRVEALARTFAFGLLRRRVRAVDGVSFTVHRGEVFGLLGPNGAGKTTTLKMLLGLVAPSAGRAELLGRPAGSLEARRRLGYLPESPQLYEHLTGAELLDLAGRLAGLGRAERRDRARHLLDRVGLGAARDLALRRYSKGMLQRAGIAQALVGDPELLLLDEPMSGLDPIGRKEVRNLVAALRAEGRTVLLSTHILSDVELLCDRAAVLVGGRLRDVGPLDRLLSPRLLDTEIVLDSGGATHLHHLPPGDDVDAFLARALAEGAHVVSVTPRRERLEDLLVREVAA